MSRSSYSTLLVFSIFLVLSTICSGQQRIGFDINSRLLNLNASFNYHKVFSKHFIFSGGIFFGAFGKSEDINDPQLLVNNYQIKSPFPNANIPLIDSTGTYNLLDYNTSGKGIGLQIGLGYFYEFSVIHGLRFNLYFKNAYVQSKHRGFYKSTINGTGKFHWDKFNHFVSAFSFEMYHTIRLSGKSTFCYGFKLPYYFSLDKRHFNPTTTKDLFSGFEPELSIGLTYVIGKCD